MNSMTGFGHSDRSYDDIDILVDLRTLNSRYFEFRAKMGKELAPLEAQIRKEIQTRLRRGRIDLSVDLIPKTSDQLELNEALVHNYLALVERLRSCGVQGEMPVSEVLELPGVCVPRTHALTSESIRDAVLETVRCAVDKVVESRQLEGKVLENELKRRMGQLARHVGMISERSHEISEYHQEKLRARLNEVMRDCVIDENRLAQEVSYYAEKSDIAEEIARLFSHMERFQKYMKEADREAVGKGLDFLCQEMNREINTILSKSALVEISQIALDAKAEIEKIREQVQNVE